MLVLAYFESVLSQELYLETMGGGFLFVIVYYLVYVFIFKRISKNFPAPGG